MINDKNLAQEEYARLVQELNDILIELAKMRQEVKFLK